MAELGIGIGHARSYFCGGGDDWGWSWDSGWGEESVSAFARLGVVGRLLLACCWLVALALLLTASELRRV